MAAVEKSSPTIMLRLFTRSASTPPTIERMTIGAKEQAVTTPNSVEQPVSRSRYSGKAKRKMALLKNKTGVIIGDRDGIPGPAIEACAKSAGAEVVFSSTECFV